MLPMKLKDYLEKHDLSWSEFGAIIGVTDISVGRYIRGDRRPDWAVVDRIAKATKGAVTANDWVEFKKNIPRRRKAEHQPAA